MIEREKTSERGNQRNHTPSLRTGSWSNSNETESLKSSSVFSGGDLAIKAGNRVVGQGTKVYASGDLKLDANDQINIGVQKTANEKTVRDNKTSWGGIGGGNNQDNSNRREVSNASQVTADGTLWLNGKQGVTITGSTVNRRRSAHR